MIYDNLPARVAIYEVGPRDGLQNESRMVPTVDKITFINLLAQTGLEHIEITSFVDPRWIPQLADAIEVARGVDRPPGVGLSALVPNKLGLERALAGGMREIAVFLSASETHNKKNINKTIAQTLAAFADVMAPAQSAGVRVRAYISTVFGCPYEGPVDAQQAVWLTQELVAMGVQQVSLSDTIGIANPAQVERVLSLVLTNTSADKLAVHLHDTRGTALANCLVAVALGITTIDAAVGGLGGCPYAPGASGNLATEDLVAMLHSMGIQTGVDLDKLVECATLVSAMVGHELPSKYLKAHVGARARAATRKPPGA